MLLTDRTGYPSIDKPWGKYFGILPEEYPTETMYEYLLKCRHSDVNQKAIIYFGNQITYGWIFDEIDKIAKCLVASGVKKRDAVMMISLNTPEVECLYYAINKIGAISCNEYVTQAPELLASTIEKVCPKLVFVQDVFVRDYYSALNNMKNVIVLSTTRMMKQPMRFFVSKKMKSKKRFISYQDWINQDAEVEVEVNHDASIPAVMLSTSGTTGVPKKVVHSSQAINAIVFQYQNSGIEFVQGERAISPAPIFLAFGVTLGMHLPLCTGLCNVNVLNPQNDVVADSFYRYKPTYFLGGIHMVRAIFNHRKEKKLQLNNMKVFGIGGESFSEEEHIYYSNKLAEKGASIPLITGYGMTEVGSTAVTEMNHVYRKGTVGVPQIGVTAKVVSTDDNSELSYNQVGEIMLTGPSVFLEYYDNLPETEKTIEIDNRGKRWVHTGDLGKIDEDGFVYIQGRIKRIYTRKCRDGVIYKIFPDYIENLIQKNEAVRACASICIEDAQEEHIPVVFIVSDEYSDKLIEDLNNMIYSVSSEYNIPAIYKNIKEIPILPNGKTDYRKLEKLI